jgi:hypothetical protein
LNEKNKNNKLSIHGLTLLKMEVKEISEQKPPNNRVLRFTLEHNNDENG